MYKFFLQKKGIITVFVTMLMVPVLAVAGIMVDVARMRLYDSQALFIADAYAESVLTDYDHLLKQLYGLFAVSQSANEKTVKENEYSKYMSASFNPNVDGSYKGFMPYSSAEAVIKYATVADANLAQNYVLETQIADFMKFRIAETMMQDFGWLDAIGTMSSLSEAIDVIEERDRISEQSSESLKDMVKYFEDIQKIDSDIYGRRFGLNKARDDNGKTYEDGRNVVKVSYSRQILQFYNMLKEIAGSEEYKYCFEHKTEYEEKEKLYKDFENSNSPFTFENESLTNMDFTDKQVEYDAAKEAHDYCKKYTNDYKSPLMGKILALESSADNIKSLRGDRKDSLFTASSTFAEMEKLAPTIEDGIVELEERMKALREKLNNLDESKPDVPEIKEKIKTEIADLEKIIQMKGKFRGTIKELNDKHIKDAFKHNEDTFCSMADRLINEYDQLKSLEIPELITEIDLEEDAKLLKGNADLASWAQWSFWDREGQSQVAGPFYKSLKDLCQKTGDESKKNNDVEGKIKEKAKKEQENINNEVDEKDDGKLRNLSEIWSSDLKSTSKKGKVEAFLDFFHGNSFADMLKNMGSNLVDRALVVSYDFNMFTCRVTDVKKESDDQEDGTKVSLTDIPYSTRVNYLYGAELEYLLGGHYKSIDNLKDARNHILAVREVMNFASTYTISEINQSINAIADAAATAASFTPAAPFAPLIRVSVSGALRLTVSGLRSAADWKALKSKEEVIFYNKNLKQYVVGTSIENFLKDVNEDAKSEIMDLGTGALSEEDALKLSYEDYIRILLLLQNSTTTLNRTSNLIMVNVNQAMVNLNPAQEEVVVDATVPLTFKMKDAATAIQSSCFVKIDFLVLPDSVAKYIYNSDKKNYFEELGGKYYGYTLSRGY